MKSKVQGIIRHVLTFGGGYAVSAGLFSTDELNALTGGLVTLVGLIWSWVAPEKKGA